MLRMRGKNYGQKDNWNCSLPYLDWPCDCLCGGRQGRGKVSPESGSGYTAVQPVKRDPVYRMALGIFMIVCWVMGLIAAINEEEKPVPLLGGIKLLK